MSLFSRVLNFLSPGKGISNNQDGGIDAFPSGSHHLPYLGVYGEVAVDDGKPTASLPNGEDFISQELRGRRFHGVSQECVGAIHVVFYQNRLHLIWKPTEVGEEACLLSLSLSPRVPPSFYPNPEPLGAVKPNAAREQSGDEGSDIHALQGGTKGLPRTSLRDLVQRHYTGPLQLDLIGRRCSYWLGLLDHIPSDFLALDTRGLRDLQEILAGAVGNVGVLLKIAEDLAAKEVATLSEVE